ncbi:MAG: hypothetical protein MJZ70_01115 [Bacteroidales bacterium]|nr:hypothetical protein [Bacteroidales bacterium]
MDLNRLIEVLTERYKANHEKISLPAPYAVPLFAEPTEKQLEQLKLGDGNPIAEMHQINSSTGLAFNYYKLYELEIRKRHNCFEVNFEDKVAKPLRIRGGRKANLDVSYSLDGTQYYIESKFLEPYYSECKHNTCSYYNKDKQGNDVDNYKFSKKEEETALWLELSEHETALWLELSEHEKALWLELLEHEKALWLELLEHEKDFQYYDFPQLYRHLLAIRREHNKQGKVVLQSVSWKMTDTFKEKYELKEDDEKMLNTLDVERQKAEELFKGFLNEIGWTDCHFEMKYYNDMLEAIKDAPKYQEFCKQYFLD